MEIILIAWKQELMKTHERTSYQRNLLFFFYIEFLAQKKTSPDLNAKCFSNDHL